MTTSWTDTWDEGEDWSGGGARAKRLPCGDELGAIVYELGPGNWLPFHFHHGSEEYLVVLRGRPTSRTATARASSHSPFAGKIRKHDSAGRNELKDLIGDLSAVHSIQRGLPQLAALGLMPGSELTVPSD